MSHYEIRKQELIIRWYSRSQQRRTKAFTIFDQFMSLWVAFNSWGTLVTKKPTDREMINTIKSNKLLVNAYANLMKNDHFKNDISRLAQYGILDMRPNHKDRRTQINDQNNFAEILNAVYQIRCNLFHGQKDIMIPHDRELVELSFRILSNIFKPVIDQMINLPNDVPARA